jgi:hypothetical protein
VSDQLTDGRPFRILAVVDDCTRESLALVADTSLSGVRVARELSQPARILVGEPSAMTAEAVGGVSEETMSKDSIMLVVGPASGKTNYIARLWLAFMARKGWLRAQKLPHSLRHDHGV